MSKFLRFITTLTVGFGLLLLYAYLVYQNSVDKMELLRQPSYYTLENYWYLLVAGCGCVGFAIISCFCAWNKKLDKKIVVLPNAVAAENEELLDWLTGSSLDTARNAKRSETSADIKSAERSVRKAEENSPISKKSAAVHGDTELSSMDCGTVYENDAEGTVLTQLDDGLTVLSDEGETVLDKDDTVLRSE